MRNGVADVLGFVCIERFKSIYGRAVDHECDFDPVHGNHDHFHRNFNCCKRKCMMDFIKSWTISVCLTLILSAVFSLISPKGTMGRFYKVIISVFIFVSLLYPFADFDFEEFNSDFDIESEFESTEENLAQMQVENIIKSVLTENQIENAGVECTVFQESDEIRVENVTIILPDEYEPERVKQIIMEETGVAANVIRQ